MGMFNSSGHSINLLSTTQVIGPQLDFMPLVSSTVTFQSPSQSTYLDYVLSIDRLWETMLKVLPKSR